MVLETWANVTVTAFQTLWTGFIAFLPKILGAAIVFFIGWAIAVGLQRLVVQILRALRIDNILEKMGAGRAFEKSGHRQCWREIPDLVSQNDQIKLSLRGNLQGLQWRGIQLDAFRKDIKEIKNDEDKKLVGEIFSDDMLVIGKRDF